MTNIYNQIEQYYENVEINVTTGTTDSQLTTLSTTFKKFLNPTTNSTENATSVIIRTNQTISVKLNKSTNDAITITSTDSPYEISGITITDMFISNASGSTAAVRLFFQPSKY